MKQYYIIIFITIIFTFCINFNFAVYQVISRPGLYKLGSDIIFNPLIDNDTIIRISVSNVKLDLGNYILRQHPNNTSIGINGIVVDANLSNIVIKNGTISNITGTGIEVNPGCSGIILENIKTFSCDLVAIECMGLDVNPINELVVDNCITISCGQLLNTFAPAFGFVVHFEECINGIFKNYSIKNNINGSAVFGPLFVNECQNCLFENIEIKENVATANCIFMVPFFIRSCLNNQFINCSIINNTLTNPAPGTRLFAIDVTQNSKDNSLLKCATLQNTGAEIVFGFSINNAEDTFLQNCLSLQNSATNEVYGFGSLAAINHNYENCIAKGNNVTNLLTGTARGFFFDSVFQAAVINCLAEEQQGGFAIGFDIHFCTNNEFKDCTALLNIAPIAANSYGFRINDSTIPDFGNNQFITNIAANNGTIAGNQMNNFMVGTFSNILYGSLNSVTLPFTNLGIVP